jgi:hypothetical protein
MEASTAFRRSYHHRIASDLTTFLGATRCSPSPRSARARPGSTLVRVVAPQLDVEAVEEEQRGQD